MNDGWFGNMRSLLHVLGVLGADRDEKGRFLVRGCIASFMGDGSEGADVAVGSDAQYRCGGQWCGLAAALNSTSYGVHKVTVI